MAPTDGASPLARSLGFNENETELFLRLLGDGLARSGIAAGPIVDKLAEGASIGEALGIPKAVGDLLYARAHVWFSAGRHDRAEGIFRILCSLEPANADYWTGWGICLRMSERLMEAETAFRTAIQMAPDWVVPQFHLLELTIRLGRWAEAAAGLARCDALGDMDLTDTMAEQLERYRSAVASHRKNGG